MSARLRLAARALSRIGGLFPGECREDATVSVSLDDLAEVIGLPERRFIDPDGVEVVLLHEGEVYSFPDDSAKVGDWGWTEAVTFCPTKAEDSGRILTLEKSVFDRRYTEVAA